MIKIEQIAIGVKDMQAAIQCAHSMGLRDWVFDEVTGEGSVFNEPTKSTARLAFNYQLGIELELIKYKSGKNWHEYRNPENYPFFLSHIGTHVTLEEMEIVLDLMSEKGIEIAQEIATKKHTNPEIAGKRCYHYIIFDSIATLGFDLKLIRRIDL